MGTNAPGEEAASKLIDAKIAELGDWRGEALAKLRSLIRQADPDVIETVKSRKPTNRGGVPTWEHEGVLCTGEIYRDKIKITFARGAHLEDPARIFNASLDGGTRRAIDLLEGQDVDSFAFIELVRRAVAANVARRKG